MPYATSYANKWQQQQPAGGVKEVPTDRTTHSIRVWFCCYIRCCSNNFSQERKTKNNSRGATTNGWLFAPRGPIFSFLHFISTPTVISTHDVNSLVLATEPTWHHLFLYATITTHYLYIFAACTATSPTTKNPTISFVKTKARDCTAFAYTLHITPPPPSLLSCEKQKTPTKKQRKTLSQAQEKDYSVSYEY